MALAAIHAKYLELCQVRSDEMEQYFVYTTEVPSDHDILDIFFLKACFYNYLIHIMFATLAYDFFKISALQLYVCSW